MTRRESLKLGAKVIGAGALIGCGAKLYQTQTLSTSAPRHSNASSETYNSGEIPITESGWTKTRGLGKNYPPLEQDINTDVVVIGAGLVGSSLALNLSEQGINTVVLESRQPGWGASGRNAGHVLPLLKDFSVIDTFPDKGRAFIEFFREHHNIPFDMANKYNIQCDASRSGYLNSMHSKESFDKFATASALTSKRLGQTLRHIDAQEMLQMTGSTYYPYGVLYESGGRINPYLFTNGMIDVAINKGASVYGDSEAISITPEHKHWIVKTALGARVRCERIVVCTNAYSSDLVPEFKNACYPLTAYALSTKPLAPELREMIMPSRATLAQVPVDLNPFIIDERHRIITASIPSISRPSDGNWHFNKHLDWIHRTWPEAKQFPIELESYWTGRVAMREQEFPGMYRLASGIYGLMHFNAWGNLMAPLMGKALADSLTKDRLDTLPFPIVKPDIISNPGKQEMLIRRLMIPAARMAQSMNII